MHAGKAWYTARTVESAQLLQSPSLPPLTWDCPLARVSLPGLWFLVALVVLVLVLVQLLTMRST